jgi:LmbE family N-acetylglucosaminyl deacetylase
MLQFDLGPARGERYSFLFVGAHCDDIEIGCGATVRKLVTRFPDAVYSWVVLASDVARADEAHAAASAFLDGAARASIEIKDFRDGYLPYTGAAVKDTFEELHERVTPDLVFTHFRLDAHQDHRLVNELTWNSFRDSVILEYEIPKFDGDLGTPSVYVAVTEAECREKIERLLEHYPSQKARSWFDEATFRAVMRLRGIECNAADGLAEAFYGRKVVVRI